MDNSKACVSSGSRVSLWHSYQKVFNVPRLHCCLWKWHFLGRIHCTTVCHNKCVCACAWCFSMVVCLVFVCVCVSLCAGMLCSCSSSVRGPEQWQQAHLLHDYRQGCCDWEDRPPTYTQTHTYSHLNTHVNTTHSASCLSQLCRPATCHMASASSEYIQYLCACASVCVVTAAQSQIKPNATEHMIKKRNLYKWLCSTMDTTIYVYVIDKLNKYCMYLSISWSSYFQGFSSPSFLRWVKQLILQKAGDLKGNYIVTVTC